MFWKSGFETGLFGRIAAGRDHPKQGVALGEYAGQPRALHDQQRPLALPLHQHRGFEHRHRLLGDGRRLVGDD